MEERYPARGSASGMMGTMRDPLAPLLADGVIDEIVGRLKSGKEAEVWLVRHAGEILAAKVYKDRDTRSFRNNAAYTEGRRVRDTRTQRAIARGSRFGRAADEDAWKAREADALHALHAGGVRVPRPHLFYEGVLLMELVLDDRGHPAPRLIDAPVPQAAAAELYRDLRRQIVAMLCCDLVHADLSPYNVLLGRAGPVLIDFPQVVGAAHNNQAERFLRRDVENLRQFLAQRDPALRAAAGDAHEIWRAYARRELTPDFVPPERAAGVGMPSSGRGARPPGAPGGGARHPHAAAAGKGPPHARGATRAQAAAHPGRHRGQPRREQRPFEVIRIVRGVAPAQGDAPAPHPRKHAGQAHGQAGPPIGSPPPQGPGHRRGGRRHRRRRR